RVKRRAFANLKIKGITPYDFRTTFATQAKEIGQTSAQVADLLGHKDTRMVERIYARTRHHSVMNQLEIIEQING
ncbi:MAG: tyrosine-type recombinase/integrase, partial [Clostridia bacterium]|nr:tyrosine-type recombinase/integrase [Clostridia bacterium]